MTNTVEKAAVITISPVAAENVRNLLAEKQMPDHCLRVYVAGIGCSGPQYGLALDDDPKDTDTLVETENLTILIDSTSLAYLQGASIDYVETPQGGGFRIQNPNIEPTSACHSCGGGCG